MAKKTLKERKEAKVGKVLHEYKEGKLKSGGSGKKVRSRKVALAIALSEADKVKRKR